MEIDLFLTFQTIFRRIYIIIISSDFINTHTHAGAGARSSAHEYYTNRHSRPETYGEECPFESKSSNSSHGGI